MRILFVSSSSGSQGGGEFYLVYLAEALKKLGHEVGLWVSEDPQMDGLVALFEPIGPVMRGPYRNTYLRKTRSFSHLLPMGRDLPAILQQWKSFEPDFLHLNKQCLEDGLDLLELASDWDIPQGCTIHITQTAVELKALLGAARDWIARRALRKFKGALWAIAANRAHELQEFVGPSKEIACIPNGVEIPDPQQIQVEKQEMRKQYAGFLSSEGPLAVSVGRLMEQKDPFRFLEIVQAWKRRSPGLSAIWVGDGLLRNAFEKKIREMGATSWIRCVGWQEQAGPFLSMADVYVHPARFEGLPFALLEAMAHGLPCVISPQLAGDLKDIPVETWILATEDPESWLNLLANPEVLESLGKTASQLARSRFSLEVMASAYVQLYEQALPGREDSP